MKVRAMILVVGLTAVLTTAVLVFSAAAVSGSSIIVTGLADTLVVGDNFCSLREALNNANSDSDTTAGDCTAGSGDDLITIPGGPFLLTRSGPDEDNNNTGDLDILDDVTIQGAGWGQTLVDGNLDDRVFHIVTPGIVVEINDMTIANGRVPGAAIPFPTMLAHGGAGILNQGGQLTLNGTVVQGNIIDNSAGEDGSGAGILNVDGSLVLSDTAVTLNTIISSTRLSIGAGIASFAQTTGADLTLIQSTVDENKANSSSGLGGGIGVASDDYLTATLVLSQSHVANNEAIFGGGLLIGGLNDFSNVSTTISSSLIEFNQAESVGGLVVGGIQMTRTQVLIQDSTFHANASVDLIDTYSGGLGGGLFAIGTTMTILGSTFSDNTVEDFDIDYGDGNGGGLYIADSTAVIANSTFSGNEAYGTGPFRSGQGGGLAVEAISEETTVTIINSTIVSNTANLGGAGVMVDHRDTMTATVNFQNTIVAGNTVTSAPDENCRENGILAIINTNGRNLEDSDSCGFNPLTDLINTPPLLGPLQNNGGPTWTQALLDFSPAIDGGNFEACINWPVAGVDQRGVKRPIGPRCDIGAYESAAQTTYKYTFLPVMFK